MKRRLKRIAAGLLFACMVLGSFPAEAVYAVESPDADTQQGENLIPEEGQNPEDVSDNQNQSDINQTEDTVNDRQDLGTENTSGNSDEESVSDNSQLADGNRVEDSLVDGQAADDTDKEEKVDTVGSSNVRFVYIESPYVETPGTQRIVFAFNEEIQGVEEISLSVADEDGNQEEWMLSRQSGSLYLFEKSYSGDAYTGTYNVVSVNLYGEEQEEIISVNELGINAEFGVNEEYDGIEELQPVEEAIAEEDASQIEASVVTIDENGVTEAQDSIADALNAVSAQATSANGISTFSASPSARSQTARSGNIVVALDPGHDANDAGAQANGLREEVLTLKIAQYCKQELEQYSGVTVYMTRTGLACPYNCTSAGSCIRQRVEAAAAAGAQIFVSLHLNASTASSANGAEVIVPNYSWRPGVATEGRELAREILDELVALGLTERSIYSKDTTIGETYQDGSISDYFSVQIYCKENNIPGIIVEHAFLTNSSDVNNFLRTESGLKKLGVADATGIAQYLGLSKGYWDTDSSGNQYYYENGKKVYGEKKIGNSWYYFDPDNNGAMATGWYTIGSRTVYYKSTGEMAIGELQIDGSWYYFSTSNGGMVTGWRNVGSRTVYYDSDGKMVTGEQQIDGNWYLFSTVNGGMITGWYTYPTRVVYYKSTGEMATGELKINGSWYYFDTSNGARVTGWRNVGSRTVYYDSDGKMVTGELKIDGNWYYFSTANGGMVTGWRNVGSRTVYYDSDGKMVTGEKEIDGKWYLFKTSNGGMTTGWYESNGYKVYYQSTGERAEGELKIDGKWYYFDPDNDGAMITGFWDLGTRTVYYNASGQLVTGEQKIDDSWYLFRTSNGGMVTGWYDFSSRRVYYDEDGKMVTGEKQVDGELYYFKPSNGAMARSEWIDGKYYDENGCYVEDNTSTLYKIEGATDVTVDQMVSLYESMASASGFTYPAEELGKGGASTLEEFCQIYYEEANAEGIKAEVAFAQAMHETGWLQFGGDVKIEQFNFAGIGATGNGASGASFNDVRTGVRAHIQHLKAYASNAPLNNEKVDPRFDYVTRNSAPYVEWLGQKENPTGAGWATSEGYGYRIKNIILQIFEY